MSHPLFRWQYTTLDDDLFSDGRTPDALTLVAQGWTIPEVVTKSARPMAAGPWWLPQDLAHADDLVTTVLHAASLFGTLPVIDARLLAEVDRLDLLATWELRVPISTGREGAAEDPRVREVRRLLRRLVTQNTEESALSAAEAVAAAIADLHHEDPVLPARDGQLAILRFRRESPGGDAADWRIGCALLYESASGPGASVDRENGSPDTGREPIRLSDPEGVRRLGLTYAERGNMERAVHFLGLAAEGGDAEAMVSLGYINRNSPDAEHLEKAYDCFREAANIGHGPACLLAGLIQAERDIFGGDEGAEAWWTAAAERGVREAPGLLGNRLRELGDITGAADWWKRGADLGDSVAALNLGCLRSIASSTWFQDDGDDSAEYWWQRALALGHPSAAGELARRRMHLGQFDGTDGVESWLLRGVDSGDAEAMYGMGLVRQMQGTIDGDDGAWSWMLRAAQAGSQRALDTVQESRIALRGPDGTIIG